MVPAFRKGWGEITNLCTPQAAFDLARLMLLQTLRDACQADFAWLRRLRRADRLTASHWQQHDRHRIRCVLKLAAARRCDRLRWAAENCLACGDLLFNTAASKLRAYSAEPSQALKMELTGLTWSSVSEKG